MGHARALLGVSSVGDQMRLREKIVAQEWSVRSTEHMIRRTKRGQKKRLFQSRRPEVSAIEEGLQEILGARVRITGRLERGRIEIYYASSEELDEIYRKISR